MRWFGLLEMSDLLLDVYTSYLALYLADVVGLSKAQVGLALSGLMLVSLAADLLLIPLLERVQGLKLVRVAAGAACLVYPAMLLAPWPGVKVALALLVRCTTLGWYPVLQGRGLRQPAGAVGDGDGDPCGDRRGEHEPGLAGGLDGRRKPGCRWQCGCCWLGPVALVAFIPKERSDRRT